MQLFGFEFRRLPKGGVQTFVQSQNDESSLTAVSSNAFYYSHYSDQNSGNDNNDFIENELIDSYRSIALISEVDTAVTEITSEAIITDEQEDSVQLNMDRLELPDNIKSEIDFSFEKVFGFLNFKNKGQDIFRRFYVDGRLYYHIMVDDAKPNEGIKDLRYIDPKKIRRVKIINPRPIQTPQGTLPVISKDDIMEYYIYNDKGIDSTKSIHEQGVQITTDSIAHVNCGITDASGTKILSYLHKALKPANQLRMLEDSVVIYRIARAPERRVFYIDTNGLPKSRAEQYINNIMNRYKTRIAYDTATGEIRDERRHLAMTEDFWIPRRGDGKATEISTLPGGEQLGIVADLDYFLKKLFKALNVPFTRMTDETQFTIGRSNELSREEARFSRFVAKLRNIFSGLFEDLIGKDLVLRGIMSIDDWENIKQDIHFDYLKDNHFAEMVETEILMSRLGALQQVDAYVGKYFSVEWVMDNVLRMTEDEMKEIFAQIEQEIKMGIIRLPEEGMEEDFVPEAPTEMITDDVVREEPSKPKELSEMEKLIVESLKKMSEK